eukprot:6598723-Prymnesium_polylepis.1
MTFGPSPVHAVLKHSHTKLGYTISSCPSSSWHVLAVSRTPRDVSGNATQTPTGSRHNSHGHTITCEQAAATSTAEPVAGGEA